MIGLEALERAIEAAGGQLALARELGIGQPSISNWIRRGKRIPAERAVEIERATGVPRHELRPDLFAPIPPRRTNGRNVDC